MSLKSHLREQVARTQSENPSDRRPRFGIGHVKLGVSDVAAATSFYTKIGMRLVADMGRAAIVELRGGTHIIIYQHDAASASLDLIVDDVDATHALFAELGANPSPIERGHVHDQFTAVDPSGNLIIINSNHAMGPV